MALMPRALGPCGQAPSSRCGHEVSSQTLFKLTFDLFVSRL